MIVGLTGGIGSGKSTVLSLFDQKADLVTYIADQRGKMLMHSDEDVKRAIVDLFGPEAYQNGQLNRSYIAAIVFENPEKLHALNAIVHPAVKADFQAFAKQHQDTIVMYESAILFESGSAENCDVVIHVFVPLQERIRRVIARDNVPKEMVEKRVKNQLSDAQRDLQSHYRIDNNSKKLAAEEVDRIYNILTKKASFV